MNKSHSILILKFSVSSVKTDHYIINYRVLYRKKVFTNEGQANVMNVDRKLFKTCNLKSIVISLME